MSTIRVNVTEDGAQRRAVIDSTNSPGMQQHEPTHQSLSTSALTQVAYRELANHEHQPVADTMAFWYASAPHRSQGIGATAYTIDFTRRADRA